VSVKVTDRVGEVLLGKYRIERELGRGGMGYVVAARHLELDELVAVKLILTEFADNADVVRRFTREARAAAKIASEHVVRVSDVGRLPSGEPYMVMELLKGQDLQEVLQQRVTLAIAEAVDYLAQVLEAVAEAHAVGIVHRDLKPANIFVTQRRNGTPCLKVLDFGISKLTGAGAASTSHEKTQGLLGSPLYMSPEQLLPGGEVDGRSDIWALGVIFFQLVTGQFPFTAESLPQLLMKVMNHPPLGLSELRPDLPPQLDAVIAKCLAKEPARRFASVTDLARALAPFGTAAAQSSLAAIENVLPGARPPLESADFPAGAPPALATPGATSTHALSSAPSPDAPSAAPSAGSGPLGSGARGTVPLWPNQAATFEPLETDSPATRGTGASGAAKPARGPVIVALAGFVGVALIGAVLGTAGLLRRSADVGRSAITRADPTPEVSAATPAPPASASASSSVAAVLGPSTPSPAPAPSVAATATAKATPVAVKPQGTESKPRPATTESSAPARAAPPPTPNCALPYVVDGSGRHIPKPECL
jgi:serine/threonine-protein kinase